jgi:hypothetical protein
MAKRQNLQQAAEKSTQEVMFDKYFILHNTVLALAVQ